MSSPFAAAKVMASRAIAPPPIRVSRWRRAVIARLAPFAAVILALSVVAGPPGSAQEPPGPASLLQDPLAGLKPPAPPGAGAVPRLTVFCSAQDKAGFLALTAKRRADARAEFLSLLDYTSEVAKRTDAVDSLYTSGKITRDVWQSARRPLVAEHDQWNPELDRRRALFYGLDKLYNDAVNADVVDCEELSRREAEERTDEAIREWRHAFGRIERLQRAGAALTDLPEAERVGYADEIQSAIYQEASADQDVRAADADLRACTDAEEKLSADPTTSATRLQEAKRAREKAEDRYGEAMKRARARIIERLRKTGRVPDLETSSSAQSGDSGAVSENVIDQHAVNDRAVDERAIDKPTGVETAPRATPNRRAGDTPDAGAGAQTDPSSPDP